IKPAVPANGAGAYQPRQSSVRFGLPGDTLIHIAFGGADVATDANFPGFACTGTYPSAATMSMSGAIGTSPDKAWYSGLVAEVILYKRALPAADLATLQAYLKAKWATP